MHHLVKQRRQQKERDEERTSDVRTNALKLEDDEEEEEEELQQQELLIVVLPAVVMRGAFVNGEYVVEEEVVEGSNDDDGVALVRLDTILQNRSQCWRILEARVYHSKRKVDVPMYMPAPIIYICSKKRSGYGIRWRRFGFRVSLNHIGYDIPCKL